MPILMVVGVIPMSLAGAAEPDGAADADPDADDAVAAGALLLLLLLLLLEELHPAASRTAATSAAITPPKRARLRIGRPAPLRRGPSLLGLTSVPSTTASPVRFDPATPARSRPSRAIYRAVSIKIKADCTASDVRRGFPLLPQSDVNLYSEGWDVNLYIVMTGECKPLHSAARVVRPRM